MKLLRKYHSLTPGQRKLLARTALLTARLLVESCLLSRRSYSEKLSRRLLRYRTGLVTPKEAPESVDKALHQYTGDVLSFVRALSLRIKRVNCLIQGYAAFTLLKQEHIASCLQIGVAKPRKGKMKAHAWLLVDGRVTLGGDTELDEFTPIACFSSRHDIG